MAADFLLQDWLTEKTLFTIPLWNWGLAALLGASSFLLMLASLKFAVARLNTRAGKVPAKILNTLAELLAATNWLLLGLASLIIGLGALNLSGRWASSIGRPDRENSSDSERNYQRPAGDPIRARSFRQARQRGAGV